MKLLIVFFILAGFSSVLSQTTQNERQYFSYHIEGTVLDEKGEPAAAVFVCFVPIERPATGRTLYYKTDAAGKFAMTVTADPNNYLITASTNKENSSVNIEKDQNFRFKSSGPIYFGAADENKVINLQFDSQTVDDPPSLSNR